MSKTVDSRIVEMKFNNKEFEAGAKQTIGTLGRLKEALKLPEGGKALESLDKAAKGIKLDGIAAGVEALADRFSTMGIVGMRVIENITDGLMNKVAGAVKFVEGAIVSGGIRRAMNIENAHFQLQALLKDESKVQAIMADAMDSVDGTAYAYDEAAKAASMFAASGLEAGEDMQKALKGITGVAAMTNSEYEGISRIFTTVAGNGRLMGDQLLQLSSRGMNAAATIADYFVKVKGEVGMTEKEIRVMVSDGEVSFRDFADAMTWAFGDSAKRANETLTGAFSNMKSAFARIGAGFVSPLIEQNGELVQMFNALRIKINDVKAALVFDEQKSAINGLVEKGTLMNETMAKYVKSGTTGFETVTKQILGTSKSEKELAEINEKLSKTFEDVKTSGKVSSDALKEFQQNGVLSSSAIAAYMTGVQKGTIKASTEVKKAVSEITNGTLATSYSVDQLAKNGKLSFDLFTEAMTWTASRTGDKTAFMQTSFKSLFAEIKKNGKVSLEDLKSLQSGGVDAMLTLHKYFNGVATGTIRASYGIKSSIDEMAKGSKVSWTDFKKYVEEGKISFDMFQAAMEDGYGTSTALTKQFTDFFLDHLKSIVDAINNSDVTKPMEVFYHWVEVVKNIAKGIGSVGKPITTAFSEVFAFDVNKIVSISKNIENLTSKFKLSERNSKNVHDAFKGVFDIAKLLADIAIRLVSSFAPVGKTAGDVAQGMLDLAGSIGRALSKFTVMFQESPKVNSFFEEFSEFVGFATEKLTTYTKNVYEFIKSFKDLPIIQKALGLLRQAFDNLFGLNQGVNKLNPFKMFIDSLYNILKTGGFVIVKVLEGIASAIGQLIEKASKAINQNGLEGFIDLLSTGLFMGFSTGLVRMFKSVSTIIGNTGGILVDVKNTLLGFQAQLKANVLKQIGEALLMIAAGVLLLSLIDPVKLAQSLGAVTVLIAELAGAMIAISKFSSGGPTDIMGGITNVLNGFASKMKPNTLKNIAVAILILAGAMYVLSLIDSDKIGDTLVVVSTLLWELVAVIGVLNKINPNAFGFYGIAPAIIALSIGIFILAAALKKISEIESEKLFEGIMAITVMLTELAIFMQAAKFGKMSPSMALGIILLAASLLILQKAVEKFGDMNGDILMQGMVAVGAILAEIGAFTFAAGESKHILTTSVSLMIMAKALEMLMVPVSEFGKMNPDTLIQGILGIGSALLALAITMQMMPKNSVFIAASIFIVAEALIVMTEAIQNMGSMSVEEINNGLRVLAASMIILALAMNAMKESIGGAFAMIIMAGALAIFVPTLKTLGGLPLWEIVKGLGALALAFTILGVAGYVLGPMVPAILSLAGAVALLGAAVALAGIGVLAFSAGLTALSVAGVAGATALVGIIQILIVGVLNIIKNSASAIGETLKTLILVACDVIVECIPKIVDTALQTILQVITSLATYGPQIAEQLLNLLISLLDLLAAKMPVIVPALVNLFVSFFSSIMSTLKGFSTETLLDAIAGIGLVAALLIALSYLSTLAPAAAVGILAFGALIAELSLVLAAVGALGQIPGLKWLMAEGGDFLQVIGTAIGQFIGGIIAGGIQAISGALPQLGADLSAFMTNLMPFIIGSKMIDAGAVACVGFLAGIILALTAAEVVNGIASFFGLSLVDMAVELSAFMIALTPFIVNSRMLDKNSMEACVMLAGMIVALTAAEIMAGIGRFFGLSGSIADFGKELAAFGPSIKQFAEDVKGVKPEAVEGAAAAASIMAEVNKKLPATGGLMQKLFGDKSLSQFGEELVAFGPSIKQFAADVVGVTPQAVQGAASAASIMSSLANGLPSSDSLWDKIFGGGQVSLSEFGNELVAFGQSMTAFAQSVVTINVSQLEGAITSFRSLVDLAQYVQNASADGLVNFSNGLAQVGTTSVQSFCTAFANSSGQVTTAIGTLFTNVSTAIAAKREALTSKGTESANAYLMGIKSKNREATSTGQILSNNVVIALQLKVGDFLVKGTASATQYLLGLKNKYPEATSTGHTLGNNALSACSGLYGNFYTAGAQGGEGFVNGLRSKIGDAWAAGWAIGNAAYEAARRALDERSPSKKMAEVADYAGIGFVNTLMYYVAKAAKAGEEVGTAAYSGISMVLDDYSITNPVIKPIVDLSDVTKSFDKVGTMFNDAIKGTADLATSASSSFIRTKPTEIQNGQKSLTNGGPQTVVTYNQYNNSPKALSRIDIYRQTKNQLSKFEREANATT